jgi:hypothetical protein
VRRGRHRVDGRSAGHSSRVRGKVFGALTSSVIVVLTGIAWITYQESARLPDIGDIAKTCG